MNADEPPIFTVRCHLLIRVTDVDAVTRRAVEDLREADIDWSKEADDLEDAAAALRNDPTSALASLAEPWRLFGDCAAVEIQGGRVWVEAGAADLVEE